MEHDQPHTAADTTQTQDLDGPDEHAAMPAAPYEDEGLPYDELADDATMPTRPRRKLLTPLTAGLAALLLGAVGFWLGVKVQKEHGSSTAGATVAGFTARRATSGKTTSAGGLAPPGAGSGAGAGGGGTTGEVAYIKGTTLYVTDSEENTVKVATSAATSVSHTVTTKSIGAIHPGDTITVQGSKSTSGAITATSVTLSTASASTATTKSATGSTGTTLFGEG